MRVLQCNLGRSVRAHDIAFALASESEANLIVVSEPNKNLVTNQNQIIDKRTDIAVIPMSRNIGITSTESWEGFAKVSFGSWHLFACYISPNISLVDFKSSLDNLMNQIRATNGESVFVGD